MKKKTINSVIFLLACVFVAIRTEITFASPQYQTTTTPTGGTITSTSATTIGTPKSTYSPGPTQPSTPTTTLMPLPVITLIFPVLTETPTASNTPDNYQVYQTPYNSDDGEELNGPPRIKVLTIIITIIWLLLAGFVLFYFRQFK